MRKKRSPSFGGTSRLLRCCGSLHRWFSLWGQCETRKCTGPRTLRCSTAQSKRFAGTLKLFRPLQAEGISVGSPEIDAPALKIVEEAQATELSRPLSKSSRRQRAMARFKEDLGQELTNRAIDRIHEHRGVPGKPAKEGS